MGKLYFVDGYHGGIRGHMPEGSFQDIMNAMKMWPAWKISLEIEPESWEYIRRNDPYTYKKIQTFIAEHTRNGRVEFISGSYAQPFCWAVNGESNVRQLIHGAEVIHRHFPEVVIDTYAVQEPCFTSALPQICAQLGFVRMSLKNPTAWGGYMAKMPGAIIHLRGGDGTVLPAVPRYEYEELVSCSATEAAGYDYPAIARFAEKCIKNGIPAPVGMCLQDLGWSSKPLVRDIDVEYTTWREYFAQFGDQVKGEVDFSQEDVLVALPWGNRIFQNMLRTVRKQENHILQVEKLLAIVESETGELSECRQLLNHAWEYLMHAQHHDGYICATTREGNKQWAFRSSALAEGCRLMLDEASEKAMQVLGAVKENPEGDIWLRVYSTTGSPRTSPANVLIGLDPGFHSLKVYDMEGEELPCQWTVMRSYDDGSLGAVLLHFEPTLEGIGYASYRVIPDAFPEQFVPNEGKKPAFKTIQDTVEVHTAYYRIIFDLTKGASLVQLYDKETGRDYAAGVDGLGSLRGFKIAEDRFIGNGVSRVICEFIENGPLQVKLRFIGSFNDLEFHTTVSVGINSRRIDFETAVVFKEETAIGYPYTPPPEEQYYGVKRSSCREDYKLGVQFPLGAMPVEITKSAPYDIYQSKLTDTRFDSWETIRHNIINGFIDFYQESSNTGLTVFCDHVNGYALVDNHFALTLGFGYHGNFWWGYQPLKGTCAIGYSLLPHPGNWEKGQVPFEDTLYREPLLVQRLCGAPEKDSGSLWKCENTNVETITVLRDLEGFKVRLFHAGYQEESLRFSHAIPGFKGVPVQLDGRPSDRAPDRIGKLEIRTFI
ncbi:MAG: hypothetical protein LBT13_08955 [Treponema sp.]|nr:hypothetical protein [Treponema sp.]